jgi:CRP-like cAMP-binding protein
MPKALQYRPGAVIYFQGDEADRIFILRTGAVRLVYQDIETGGDAQDSVQPGEFFGVKSALGRYPREENAVAVKDAGVMAFSVAEFEQFALGNTRIIMTMLRVFSTQLRRIHRQVANLMETKEHDPEMGLFNVGQYYLNNQRFPQAKYVFSRYLTYYPTGKNAAQAARFMEAAENGLVQQGAAAPPSRQEKASPAAKVSETAKTFMEAVRLASVKKYQQAYMAFKRIADANTDAEYGAKSAFEIGRCLFLMGKYDDCINYFTRMITQYPKHPSLGEALFFMGQSYEKRNLKDQGISFYKKILSMIEDTADPVYIRTKQALKDAGA